MDHVIELANCKVRGDAVTLHSAWLRVPLLLQHISPSLCLLDKLYVVRWHMRATVSCARFASMFVRSFVRCKLLLRPFFRKAGKIPLSETSIEFHRSQQSPPILPMSYYYLRMIIRSSKRVEY